MSKKSQRRGGGNTEAASSHDRTVRGDCPVIVVGIGTSESGLKSLKQIFTSMPPGHGVAFVIVLQHPGSPHENPSLGRLSDETAFSVVEAEDGMPVLADRIHVMPADKFLNISGSILTLHEPIQCNGLWMPIDHFFCSLASDQKHRGCGILLSGKGSDGVMGLSEVKAMGGRTMAEDPASAGLPELPQNAIDAGVTDTILTADNMVEAIVAMAGQVAADTKGEPAEAPEFDAGLRDILDILRVRVGHDFRCYKPNTLVRRIRRRMSLGKVESFAEYARVLEEHPEEVRILHKDLLIGVTGFFRQPDAWKTLREKVLSRLVEKAKEGSEIRVWIPGCSTGQEVYSLAMVITRQIEDSGKKVDIRIFATDTDDAALATARSGSYPEEEIAGNISPELRKRFFEHRGDRYQIIKDIRQQIVFAPQNLTGDPPFSRLDLIICRNLLIYLDAQMQRKIITLFHFALGEGGFLFLGNAESIGDREDLFEPVSKKWRIYRRIGVGRPVDVEIPVRQRGAPFPASGRMSSQASCSRVSLTSVAHQMLLDRFAPACVMIDRKLQVLYVHGGVEGYLTYPPGELTTRVVDMAREGLRARLRGAISKCLETNRLVSLTARVRRGEKSVPVRATVSPLQYPREADGLLLVTFEDYRVPAAKSRKQAAGESDLIQLQDELKVTREELQSTIEQLEISNDQLKASNEEVTAANEELQSANEELETSKEELQSLNEELNTINARLHEKVVELEEANDDVVNLLSSTSIATVFLDKELRVRRYTPAITGLMSLIASDVGRPIADILRRFRDEALLEDAARVLAYLSPVSREVQAEDGRWYIRRITPYRTQDDRIEGVVLTLVDITVQKQGEEILRNAKDNLEMRVLERTAELEQTNRALNEEITERRRAEEAVDAERKRFYDVLETLPAYLVLLTPDYHVPFANRFFRERFGESHGLRCFEYLFGLNEPCEVCETFKVLKTMTPHEWEWTGPDGHNYYVYDFPFFDTDGSTLIMEMGIDITDRKQAEAELRIHKEHLEEIVRERTAELEGKNVQLAAEIAERKQVEEALRYAKEDWERTFNSVPDMIAILDDQHRIMRVNPAMARRLGCTPDECVGLPCYSVVHGTDAPPVFCPHKKTLADGGEYTAEVHEERLGGDFLVSTTPISDEQGRMIGSVHVARDITEIKQAEEQIRSEALFPEENPFPILRASVDGTLIYANNSASGLLDQWQCQVGASVPEPVQQILKAAAASGRHRELEIRCNTSDVSLALVPIVDRGYVNFYGRDITEHKLADKALRESEDDLNRAQAVAHIGSWRLNIQKNELLWSDETYRIFGIPKGTSMTYETFMGAVHPDDRAYVDQTWNATLIGRPYYIEHRIVVGDAIKWVRERAELELDADGKLLGGFGIAQDITEKKQTEEALQKAHDELEIRVHERTAELRKINEALEQSNRDLEDFAFVSSHDLQEPLRKIQTFSDRLITGYQESLDDNARFYLQRMQHAAKRMQDLILDVLKYSRIRTRPELFSLVNLKDRARESMSDLKVIRKETQADILIDELPVIEADPVQMRQLFQNLFENAIKYRGEEPPAIRVYSVQDHSDGFCEIHIKDNGIGFDEQYLDRIFKPFQRLHWQSSPYPGTGMGLAICRRIVERHGGSITAMSLPGKGSTFIVRLPLRQESKKAEVNSS